MGSVTYRWNSFSLDTSFVKIQFLRDGKDTGILRYKSRIFKKNYIKFDKYLLFIFGNVAKVPNVPQFLFDRWIEGPARQMPSLLIHYPCTPLWG